MVDIACLGCRRPKLNPKYQKNQNYTCLRNLNIPMSTFTLWLIGIKNIHSAELSSAI